MWATVKLFMKPQRKNIKGQVVLVSMNYDSKMFIHLQLDFIVLCVK